MYLMNIFKFQYFDFNKLFKKNNQKKNIKFIVFFIQLRINNVGDVIILIDVSI